MPNRFRPAHRPAPRQRTDPGELIAGGIEAFQAAKRGEEERERAAEGEGMQRVMRDVAFDRFLEDEGLTPALPEDIEQMRDRPARTLPDQPDPGLGMARGSGARPPEVFAGEQPGMARRRPPEGAPDFRSGFDRAAEAGPEALTRPSVLPGQFVPGMGFSPTPVYEIDQPPAPRGGPAPERPGPAPRGAPDPGVPDFREEFGRGPSLDDPRRVTLGGRDFFQGERRADADQRLEREEMDREIERLIAAGVPEDRARFAAEDPALRREFLRPEDETETVTPEEWRAAGLSPELAAVAAKDPGLGRSLVAAQQAPRSTGDSAAHARFRRDVMRDAAEAEALNLFAQGASPEEVMEALREVPEFRGLLTPAMISNVRRQAQALTDPGQLPAAVRERRSQIMSVYSTARVPIVEEWQQQIVDRIAGVGPGGQPMQQPMTPQDILARFEEQHAAGEMSDRDFQAVQAFLRPALRQFRHREPDR